MTTRPVPVETQEPRGLGWLVWPAALNGVCAAVIVAFALIALGYLHPAFALPPIGLGVLGVLARPVRVRPPAALPPSDTEDPPGEPSDSI